MHPELRRALNEVDRRMEALENAIRSRDWEDVEFQYDRVLSSVSKAQGRNRGRVTDTLKGRKLK